MNLVINTKEGTYVGSIHVSFFGYGASEKIQEIKSKGREVARNIYQFDSVEEVYNAVKGHIGKIATGRLLHYASNKNNIISLKG